MFQATVKNRKFSIDLKDGSFLINDEKIDLDIDKIDQSNFHLLKGSKSYSASVISVDYKSRTAKIVVNDREYEVALKNRTDLILEEMGLEESDSKLKNEIKAPMPGLILDVSVTEGMQVEKGQPLLILEAMKMENIIKSPSQGVVSNVSVSVGDSVEKNHTMIVL